MATNSVENHGSPASALDQHECNPPHACIGCLAASGLGAELTQEQIGRLFEVADVRRLSKGEVLISEGEFDNKLYAVAKGEFEVTRGDGANRVPLARLGPGTLTGELAFLDGLKRTATVSADQDGSCVIALDRGGIESLLADAELVYKVMRAILRSAHRTVGKMDSTYSDMMHYIQG
jgi:CRP-like cAMP-binding protein